MDRKITSHHHHQHKHGGDDGTSIKQVDITNISSVNDYFIQLSKSNVFSGGHLAKAVDILEAAKKDNASIFVGLAGAMIPGGMREVICQAIRDGFIQALTTTGANITHDLMEAVGGGHVHSVEYESDIDLRDRGIDRVYDAFVKDGSFESFEDFMRPLLEELYEERKKEGSPVVLAPSELIEFIATKITDENSIVKTAYDHGVPIFIPAFSDSVLGLQVWLFTQFNSLVIDSTKDLGRIQDLYHEAKSNCAFLLGGGVPKNYTLQSALMAVRNYKYAVQITLDRVETGGLSGATLEEAISWGKLEPDAQTINVTSDLTIALPLIFTALRQRFNLD